MSDTQTSNNDTVSMRTLVFAIFISIAGTVGVLDWQGKIVHVSNEPEQYSLADYKVIYIPEEDVNYRLSQKPSHQSSACHNGYLFIENDLDDQMQGLLVDYKNRGIKCAD